MIEDEFPSLGDTFSKWKDKSGDRSDSDKLFGRGELPLEGQLFERPL